jgi:hypothetical protein
MNLRLAILTLLLLPAVAAAQDMPLFTIAKSGETWKPATGERPKGDSPKSDFSPDGSVLFQGKPDAAFVLAINVTADSNAVRVGTPYCPLRIEQGYDNGKQAQEKRRKEPATLAVTSLMVDAQGRIYAGTKLGIRVFDPTGRLCGVLALPAEGNPEHLGWEGDAKDRLVVWIGDKKFTRAMKATGK